MCCEHQIKFLELNKSILNQLNFQSWIWAFHKPFLWWSFCGFVPWLLGPGLSPEPGLPRGRGLLGGCGLPCGRAVFLVILWFLWSTDLGLVSGSGLLGFYFGQCGGPILLGLGQGSHLDGAIW